MVELDSAAVAAGPQVAEDLDVLQDVQVVDEPRSPGRLLVVAGATLVVAGVALATVSALGIGSILDVARLIAGQ